MTKILVDEEFLRSIVSDKEFRVRTPATIRNMECSCYISERGLKQLEYNYVNYTVITRRKPCSKS